MARYGDSSKRIGSYSVTVSAGEKVRAYIPRPLPPEPALRLEELFAMLETASRNLGRLDGSSSIFPSRSLLLYMYVRKEALLSAQIEGTQSSFSDVLLYESDGVPGVPEEDVEEVSNYVAAANLGIRRVRQGMPIANRLIRELHGILLRGGRGSTKLPGEFRRSQNWIGGTRPGNALFVPPPAHAVAECMSDLEKYINSDQDRNPALIRAALVHAQFETIHPFLDGNGRLGRLLITIMLVAQGLLREPLLYLSLYFKKNRTSYYERLQAVRTEGDWEAWIEFFLSAVAETSEQAFEASRELHALFEGDQARIEALGRGIGSVLQVYQQFQNYPILSARSAKDHLPLSAPTIRKAIDKLVQLGVLVESTGKKRGRIFSYAAYLEVLARGTEPIN